MEAVLTGFALDSIKIAGTVGVAMRSDFDNQKSEIAWKIGLTITDPGSWIKTLLGIINKDSSIITGDFFEREIEKMNQMASDVIRKSEELRNRITDRLTGGLYSKRI